MSRFILLLLCTLQMVCADGPDFRRMEKWSLDKKLARINSEGFRSGDIDRKQAFKLVYHHMAQRHSVQWQGNANGLRDVRKKMERIRPAILEAAYSGDTHERTYAVDLGKYLLIDGGVEKMFYHVLEKELVGGGQGKLRSLDAIFGYGLDTPELRKELVSGLSPDKEVAEKSRLGSIAMGRSGRWGLHEATENLISLLEENYQRTGNVKHGALKSLKELGPAAIEVLPRIKALHEQRKKDGDADFREVESLEFAIRSISGKPDPRRVGQHERPQESRPDKPDPRRHDPVTKKADVPVAAASSLKNKWPIILVVVLVLGAVFVWLKARSRA